MAQLIVKNGPQSGQAFTLKPGMNRVGRHPENDIVLEDPSVSLFHAEFKASEIAIAFRDLVSTNGSYLNQQRFLKGVLPQVCLLHLGGTQLELQVEQAYIAIPEQEFQAQPDDAYLDDGSAACFIHRIVPATLGCLKCGRVYCDECVRRVGLAGRESKCFCPECSGACSPLVAQVVIPEDPLIKAVKLWKTRISNAFRPKRRR